MALDPDDNDRAQEVGQKIGWDLQFIVAPNPELVGTLSRDLTRCS